jgi:hypothetical protein
MGKWGTKYSKATKIMTTGSGLVRVTNKETGDPARLLLSLLGDEKNELKKCTVRKNNLNWRY